MPNWVINHVECDNLQALAELRDFNRIVPEPVALGKTESGADVGHYLQQRQEGRTLSDILQNPPRYRYRYNPAIGTYEFFDHDEAAGEEAITSHS